MLHQFCKYNNWANSLLLAALMDNPAALSGPWISLFSHLVNAQSIWVSRINGSKPDVGVWQVHDLNICRQLLNESENSLSKMEYTEATAIATLIKYTTSTGDRYETSVADILLHVFNHGTYHRAQIAREMKLNGLNPIQTDYILFVRQQANSAPGKY